MGFSSRLAVAAWAVGLATTALGLSSGGCARESGEPESETRTPVNASDLVPGRCIDACEPDYGSAPVDCAAAEAGIEFFPVPVWDFDADIDATDSAWANELAANKGATRTCADNQPVRRAIASYSYSYSDETTELLRTDDCECEVAECDVNRYEPNTQQIERCGQMTHALHVRGGPFLEWGGGIGRRLQNFARDAATALGGAACPARPSLVPDPATPAFCADAEERIENAPGRPTANGTVFPFQHDAYYGMVVDLREWEGISFWARRGPDGQAGFRVALGDRNVDDDVSFLEFEGGLTPRCSRVKQCECRQKDKLCLSGNPDRPGNTYCWNPAFDPPPSDDADERYERCGNFSCDEDYAAFTKPDAAFTTADNGSEAYQFANVCSFHTFASDETGDYCFDPVHGPPPAESTERCGDTWLHPVALGPDWQFFKIPFAELRQEGWAKRFPRLDVAGVTMVRFTWSVGWVDYWLDDVRFYRRRK